MTENRNELAEMLRSYAIDLRDAIDNNTLDEFMESALEVRSVKIDDNFEGVRILLAFGGPNIWLDTDLMELRGFWAGQEEHLQLLSDDCAQVNAYFDYLAEE